jgi:hypothetical protein
VRNSSPELQTSAGVESGLQVLNRFPAAVLSTVLLRSWVLAQFCCDQSAVAMRLFAGLTSAQLALLSRLGTTSRTLDSEYQFWAEFSAAKLKLDGKRRFAGHQDYQQAFGLLAYISTSFEQQ